MKNSVFFAKIAIQSGTALLSQWKLGAYPLALGCTKKRALAYGVVWPYKKYIKNIVFYSFARVAELVDAWASKAYIRQNVKSSSLSLRSSTFFLFILLSVQKLLIPGSIVVFLNLKKGRILFFSIFYMVLSFYTKTLYCSFFELCNSSHKLQKHRKSIFKKLNRTYLFKKQRFIVYISTIEGFANIVSFFLVYRIK